MSNIPARAPFLLVPLINYTMDDARLGLPDGDTLLQEKDQKSKWTTSLFGCFDRRHFMNFLLSLYCPCARFALSSTRAKLRPNIGFCGWLMLYLLIFSMVTWAPWVWPWCAPLHP